MKEFKTYNQQLIILRNRGMNVPTDGKPKRFLEQENYYNVINGYKDLFLQKDGAGNPLSPEIYLPGTHFNELKALFLFDRELRNLFLRYILKFESLFKTTYAYEFSKQYRNPNSYLDLKNYTRDHPEQVVRQIHVLTGTIKDKATKDGAIKHYIQNHESVPLWVLVNYLTLGNMSYLFSALKSAEKATIAKVFSDRYNKQYKTLGGSNQLKLREKDVIAALKILGLVRNQCAHEERLFNTIYKNIYISNVRQYLNVVGCSNDRLVAAVLYLRVFLSKNDFLEFKKELRRIIEKYDSKFITVPFDDVLKCMGLDKALLNSL